MTIEEHNYVIALRRLTEEMEKNTFDNEQNMKSIAEIGVQIDVNVMSYGKN